MLKSPIIYDSLFSLEIVDVIYDNLSANRSMSACSTNKYSITCGIKIVRSSLLKNDMFSFI